MKMSRANENSLAVAAFEGRRKIVSLVLDRGANINALGGDYLTTLGAAVAAERKNMVLSLPVGRGADINIVIGQVWDS